jgi:hypothetical protein
MVTRLPTSITTSDQDLVPGGDLRTKGNLWLMGAFVYSGLKKVPRETRLRVLVQKLMKKRKIGISPRLLIYH